MNKESHPKSNYPQIILLREAKTELQQVTKVGIIPFIPHVQEGQWKFMLMKPHAELGHPGALPEFQIAKGTRRINMGDGWCDMRDDDLLNADPVFYENLIETALREGEEEIGLRRSNVTKLFDVGVFFFVSAKRGIRKPLHVFAAEIKEPGNFGTFESKTALTTWMKPDEFGGSARADHVSILQVVHENLTKIIR